MLYSKARQHRARSAAVHLSQLDKNDKKLDEAVQKMFDKCPPKPKGQSTPL
jgi:hypothetical protein